MARRVKRGVIAGAPFSGPPVSTTEWARAVQLLGADLTPRQESPQERMLDQRAQLKLDQLSLAVVIEMREDYDWQQAFAYAGSPIRCEGCACSDVEFTLRDVLRVVVSDAGTPDEQPWVAVLQLHDGCYAYLEAGCDYTGWDCQAWGSSWVADTLEALWQFGVTEDARDRFTEAGYAPPGF